MEVLRAIEGRRAIRKYKALNVEDRKIETILRAARWAPYGNIHPWEFIVIKDKTILKKLWRITPGAFGDAPLAIVICVDIDKAFKEGGVVGRDFCSIADPSFAAQNILLAAYGLGLGSCPIISFPREAIKILLEMPKSIRPVYIISIGYADEAPSPPPRPPLEEIVFLNKYGEKFFK